MAPATAQAPFSDPVLWLEYGSSHHFNSVGSPLGAGLHRTAERVCSIIRGEIMLKFSSLCAMSAMLVSSLAANAFCKENPVLVIKTSEGDIKVELFAEEAPISTKNFLEYADAGFYDGTVFHRIIDGFMVQGGGFTKDMEKKETRAPIQNEAGNGLSNEKYTLAMARTNVPNSATSQFFINTVDNDFLDRAKSRDGVGYAVFGKVVEGHEVVDKLGKVKTNSRDEPIEQIVIEKVTRVEDDTQKKADS